MNFLPQIPPELAAYLLTYQPNDVEDDSEVVSPKDNVSNLAAFEGRAESTNDESDEESENHALLHQLKRKRKTPRKKRSVLCTDTCDSQIPAQRNNEDSQQKISTTKMSKKFGSHEQPNVEWERTCLMSAKNNETEIFQNSDCIHLTEHLISHTAMSGQTNGIQCSNDDTQSVCSSIAYDTDDESDRETFTEAQLNLIETVANDVNGKSILSSDSLNTKKHDQGNEQQCKTNDLIPFDSRISINVSQGEQQGETEQLSNDVSISSQTDDTNNDENCNSKETMQDIEHVDEVIFSKFTPICFQAADPQLDHQSVTPQNSELVNSIQIDENVSNTTQENLKEMNDLIAISGETSQPVSTEFVNEVRCQMDGSSDASDSSQIQCTDNTIRDNQEECGILLETSSLQSNEPEERQLHDNEQSLSDLQSTEANEERLQDGEQNVNSLSTESDKEQLQDSRQNVNDVQSIETKELEDNGHIEVSINETCSSPLQETLESNNDERENSQLEPSNMPLILPHPTEHQQNDCTEERNMEESENEQSVLSTNSDSIESQYNTSKIPSSIKENNVNPSKESKDAVDYILNCVNDEDVDAAIVDILCRPSHSLDHSGSALLVKESPYSLIPLENDKQVGSFVPQPIELLEVTIGNATEDDEAESYPFLPPERQSDSSVSKSHVKNTSSTENKSKKKSKGSPNNQIKNSTKIKNNTKPKKDRSALSADSTKRKKIPPMTEAKKQHLLSKHINNGQQMKLVIPLLPKSVSRKKRIKVLGKCSPHHQTSKPTSHDQRVSNCTSTINQDDKSEGDDGTTNHVSTHDLGDNLEQNATDLNSNHNFLENDNIDEVIQESNPQKISEKQKSHPTRQKETEIQQNVEKGKDQDVSLSVSEGNDGGEVQVPTNHKVDTPKKKMSKRALKENLWREIIASKEVYDLEFEILLKEKQELENSVTELKTVYLKRTQDKQKDVQESVLPKKRRMERRASHGEKCSVEKIACKNTPSLSLDKQKQNKEDSDANDEISALLKEKEDLKRSTKEMKGLYRKRKKEKEKCVSESTDRDCDSGNIHDANPLKKGRKETSQGAVSCGSDQDCTENSNGIDTVMQEDSENSETIQVESSRGSLQENEKKGENSKEEYLEEKVKQLEKENENLKTNPNVIDFMKEFTDEIKSMKSYLQKLEQKGKKQDSFIQDLEHEIAYLKKSQQHSNTLPSPCYSDRQDATVTSTDTDA